MSDSEKKNTAVVEPKAKRGWKTKINDRLANAGRRIFKGAMKGAIKGAIKGALHQANKAAEEYDRETQDEFDVEVKPVEIKERDHKRAA